MNKRSELTPAENKKKRKDNFKTIQVESSRRSVETKADVQEQNPLTQKFNYKTLNQKLKQSKRIKQTL